MAPANRHVVIAALGCVLLVWYVSSWINAPSTTARATSNLRNGDGSPWSPTSISNVNRHAAATVGLQYSAESNIRFTNPSFFAEDIWQARMHVWRSRRNADNPDKVYAVEHAGTPWKLNLYCGEDPSGDVTGQVPVSLVVNNEFTNPPARTQGERASLYVLGVEVGGDWHSVKYYWFALDNLPPWGNPEFPWHLPWESIDKDMFANVLVDTAGVPVDGSYRSLRVTMDRKREQPMTPLELNKRQLCADLSMWRDYSGAPLSPAMLNALARLIVASAEALRFDHVAYPLSQAMSPNNPSFVPYWVNFMSWKQQGGLGRPHQTSDALESFRPAPQRPPGKA